MRKISNKSAKAALKKWKKKYADIGPSYDTFDRRIRLRRIILGYEVLVKSIDRLNWVVDTDFADGDDFKRDRYNDWKGRITAAKNHIDWVKGR